MNKNAITIKYENKLFIIEVNNFSKENVINAIKKVINTKKVEQLSASVTYGIYEIDNGDTYEVYYGEII